MVADGMGGAPAGDLASVAGDPDDAAARRPGTGATCSRRWPAPSTAPTTGSPRRSRRTPRSRAWAPPSTPCCSTGTRIGVAHLGDSRGYLWRDGELLRLTSDHTWVQSLIDEGRITEDEAKIHAHRSLLLKVLDGRHDNDPDLTLYDVQAGDRILLCSDGLSGFVPHDRIERALSIGTAESVATELVTLALEGMSNDNITVVARRCRRRAARSHGRVHRSSSEPRPTRHRPIRNRLRGWAPPRRARGGDAPPRRHRPRGAALRTARAEALPLGVAQRSSRSSSSRCSIGGRRWAYGWTQKQYYVSQPTASRSRSTRASRPTCRASTCTTSTRCRT